MRLEVNRMSQRRQLDLCSAVLALLCLLPCSNAGEWCENFENGPGTFWHQPDYQGGLWYHASVKNETLNGDPVPRTLSGEDGVLLLRPFKKTGLVVWSMLVSPEMKFSPDATIELDYWLWFNVSQPQVPLSFMLFRRVNGVEDEEAFLNISAYANVAQSHWASIECGVDTVTRGDVFQIAIYGYTAGETPDMFSKLGIDRVILRGVQGDNSCGGNGTAPTVQPPTAPPGPTTTPLPETTTEPHPFFCPAEQGLFLDPYDCHHFYQCSGWHAFRMVCPANLVFNLDTKECDYRKNVPRCL